MSTLLQDLRYGLRMLRKSPGFTAVAILTLALGIGANTAIFSLVDAFFLRPVPCVSQPQSLVRIEATKDGSNRAFSYQEYSDYRRNDNIFKGLAAFRNAEFQLGGDGEAQRVQGACISSNYFAVLGIKPALGRWFLPEEDEIPGADPVAVISYQLWRGQFHSDPEIIGKNLLLNGHAFTIVGVAAEGFRGMRAGDSFDIWVPLAMYSEAMPDVVASFEGQQFLWLHLIGRLKPGLSMARGQANLSALSRQLQLAYPQMHLYEKVILVRSFEFRFDEFEGILFAAVGFLLFVSCANIANLLLSRNSTRRMEFAVRQALGASRGRLVCQLLIEGTILSFLGGAAALLVARWEAQLLLPFLNVGGSSLAPDLRPDIRVLGFTFAIAVVTTISFALTPALQAAKSDLALELKEFSPGTTFRKSRLRNFLVVFQIGVSLVLLVGAELLLKTLRNFDAIQPDFESKNILLATVQPGMEAYSQAQLSEFYGQVQRRIESLPGVQAAALSTDVIAGGFFKEEVAVEGHEPPPGEAWTGLHFDSVSPGYFRAMRLPLVRGREFDWGDATAAPEVLILNESASRRLFGAADPVGRFIRIRGERKPREVVGVVKDAWDPGVWGSPLTNIYFPLLQDHPWWRSSVTMQVRAAGNPMAELPAIRRAVWSLDKNLPVYDVSTIDHYLRESQWVQRAANAVTGVAGLLALVLAMVGIYGVISYSFTRRTREIGIRMALGAQRGDVLWMVIREGMMLAGMGIVLGVCGAVALTRFLRSLLFEIKPTDPATFVGVAILLVVLALAASYIPARRAMRVDPMVALRYE